MQSTGPLAGIRVLDLADAAGATCGKLLASLGAETILVEPPQGSPMRRIGPFAGGAPHPDQSLFFWHYAAGKQSVTINLDEPAGKERFLGLVALSDVLIETFPPGYLATRGLGYEQLAARHPGLVVVSITPFGQQAPYARYRGSDLVCQALGGMVAVNGACDGPPLPGVGLPAYYCAGMYGAVGALLAVHAQRQNGRGQWIDVSIQASVVASVAHATSGFLTDGRVARRQGNLHWSRDFRIDTAADGHVVHSTLGDWTTLVEWVRNDGKAQNLTAPEWASVEYRREHCAHLFDVLDQWSQQYQAAELGAAAQLRRLPIAPVRPPEALADDPHLAERGHFVTVRHAELELAVRYPGPAFRFSRTPCPALGRPPRLAVQTSPSLEPLRSRPPFPIADLNTANTFDATAPLAGVRVIDFTWVVAGPLATRMLADFGAEVIKIERLNTPRNPSRRHGLVGNLNRGKRSLAVDLSTAEGLALVRRIVATADIVIDNFSARVMSNLGLQHEALAALKPGIITVNLSGFGLSGPYRDFVSYGPTLQALAGHTWLMRPSPDGPPVGWGFSYSDMVAGCTTALAVLAALWHRQTTGEGQHLEVSQFEALIASLGPTLLSALNPALSGMAEPSGVDNYSQEMPGAPLGVFRCADLAIGREQRDRWCAIAVFTDADWELCRAAMGDPSWSHEPRFAARTNRLAHRDDLHALVESWTCQRAAEEVMHVLQAHGVAAGLVATADDLVGRDPQLRARDYWRSVRASDGTVCVFDGVPLHLSRTPARIDQPAPLLGEHSAIVLQQLLGLSTAEIEALRANRVIHCEEKED